MAMGSAVTPAVSTRRPSFPNGLLVTCGYRINDDGRLATGAKASTLPEAARPAGHTVGLADKQGGPNLCIEDRSYYTTKVMLDLHIVHR